jgi:hypothetical protein
MAGVKNVGTDAVGVAYRKLKDAVISRTSRKAAIESLEEDPTSEPQKQVVQIALEKAGAQSDPEILRLAINLNDLILRLVPEDQRAIGVVIDDIEGSNVFLRNIESSGSGVVAKNVRTSGDFVAENVKAGVGTSKKN